MYRLFALDRAHRLCQQLLCCVWLTVLLVSLFKTAPVQSAPTVQTLKLDNNITTNPTFIRLEATSRSSLTEPTTVPTVVTTTTTTTATVSTKPLQKSYPERNSNDTVRSVNDSLPISSSPFNVPNNASQANNDLSPVNDLLAFDPESGPYLLMCSVKSIRYWSPKCPLHSSSELLSHRPSVSNLRNGFSGISVRKSQANNWTELVWFDVEKYEFHLARLALRSNATQCDNPLTFAYSTTLDYSSNPRALDYKNYEEKMVKITSSSRHLIVANYFLDRIDIYNFNEAKMNLLFIESIDAVRPSDIVFQRNHLIWLENGLRICRIRNLFHQHRQAESECHESNNETILAFTVLKDKNILYSTKVHGNIYHLDWNTFDAQFLGSIDLPEIVSMTSMNSNIIFFSENDGQVHRLNISNGFHDLEAVSIESATIFDIHFMDNDFDVQSESNYFQDDHREIINVASHPSKLLLICVFVCCSIAVVYGIFMIFRRRDRVRLHISNIQAKLPNARGLLRNVRPYAQMRQSRASSISNALIEDDDDSLTNFRHNISVHRPIPANDIEDLLRSGAAPQASVRCITCRDPGVCHDKGFCMATYRSQHQ